MAKQYYWLQLKEDFFRQKEIKLLRKIAGGDTYTIIYLKMMLMSLKDEGKILYEGVGSNLAEEIALEIDEDAENVQITINYLMGKNLLVTSSEYEGFLSDVPNLIGSESDSARRVRKHRQIKKVEEKKLQCNAETLQGNTVVTNGNTEIEIEIDIEIEKELEDKKDNSPKSNKRIYDVDSIPYQLAEYLFEEMKKNNHEARKPDLHKWANDIRLMMEIDNRKEEQVRNMITWSQSNEFWKGVILSAKKLRDKYDQMKVQANQPYKNNNAAAPKNDSVKYDIKQSEFFKVPEGYSFDD